MCYEPAEAWGGKAGNFRRLRICALLWVAGGAVYRMAQDGGQTDASETATDQQSIQRRMREPIAQVGKWRGKVLRGHYLH
jgi:hypothetical protein